MHKKSLCIIIIVQLKPCLQGAYSLVLNREFSQVIQHRWNNCSTIIFYSA